MGNDYVYVGVKKLVEANEGEDIYLEMWGITLVIYYRVPPEYVVYPEVSLLWPGGPGLIVEEGETYPIRFSASAEDRLDRAYALLSLDRGVTFPELIDQQRYVIPPDSVVDDTLEWTVTTPPSNNMRVMVKVRSVSGKIGSDTSDYDIGYKLRKPGNPQFTLTDSGLAFSWTDRSSYETRYSVAFWLRTWEGDTVEWGQKIANANGTSGFIAWTDSTWNHIPSGTGMNVASKFLSWTDRGSLECS